MPPRLSEKDRGELIIRRKCALIPPGYGNARYILKDDLEIHVHYFLDYTLAQIEQFQHPGLHIAFDDVAQSPRPWIRVYYALKCGTTIATVIPRTKTGIYPTKSKVLPSDKAATHNRSLGYILALDCWQICGKNYNSLHLRAGQKLRPHLAKRPEKTDV